jgi:cholesterol oxidase
VYDYIVVGSGLGGSVASLRLSEKGYSVLTFEKGQRFDRDDFPKSNWNLRKYLWLPKFGFFGIQKITFNRKARIISGVGVYMDDREEERDPYVNGQGPPG